MKGQPGSGEAPELERVLTALARCRTPGWNFPGHFLALSFDELGEDESLVSLEPGPHCTAAGGEASLAALAVLADIGLAACMRRRIGLASRMATVAMALQFTGAKALGRLEARGRFDGFLRDAKGQQGLMRLEVRGAQGLVCTGNGTFMGLGEPPGASPMPMLPRSRHPQVAPLAPAQLAEDERAVHERAVAALAAKGPGAFIDRFWGILPRHHAGGASCELDNGLHVGNRVGHTQGGLTWALAVATASAALVEEHWHLVGATACYVAPGTGPRLRAEAEVAHRGRLTAAVRTRVTDAEGRAVLEVLSNHSRAAP